MTPESRRRIEELYQEALPLPPAERAALLKGADAKLRREVEALLAQDTATVDFTARPGTLLGPYRIEQLLGTGGMGQVFRATDTRLGRAVAIKFSQARFDDRFQREARAISALNHAHICTLYDVGPNYLVMELVEGETLAARLAKGSLPVDAVVRYGAQIADALAAAHRKGIIHRDLKPGNIMLTKAGVKVLDFGLAKLEGDETLTVPQAVMGTPAYMAPEQREGGACDARSDIYALGLVLREMIVGKRASGGGMEKTPPQLAHVVERCLPADPDERWQAAGDVRRELEFSLAQPPALSKGNTRTWIPWTAAALLTVALVLLAHFWLAKTPGVPRVVRLVVALPEEVAQADPGRLMGPPAISPDGSMVTLALGPGSASSLWLRRLDSDGFVHLAGTEGDATQPFWSPDGTQIAFFAGGKLKKLRVPGGAPEVICDVPTSDARGGAWSSRGVIVFGVNYKGLMKVSENGGEPVQVAGLDPRLQENSLRFPEFFADGNRFIYFSRTLNPQYHAIYLDSLDSIGKQPRRRILAADGPASVGHDPVSRQDFLLFPKDGRLWAQRFETESAGLSGVRTTISDDVGQFSLSSTGTLVYRKASSEQNFLVWFDRSGKAAGRLGQPGDYWNVQLSPDERYAAVVNHRSAEGRFWVELIDVSRNLQTPLSDVMGRSFAPVWSRDSHRIYWLTVSGSGNEIRVKPIDGAVSAPLAGRTQDRYDPCDLSPDGKTVVAERVIESQKRALSLAPFGDLQWEQMPLPGSNIQKGQFSPDGRWIAYQSDESGNQEIYVIDFPGMQRKLRISTKGGSEPRWRGNGSELFYIAPPGTVMSVPIEGVNGLQNAKPVALFNLAYRVAKDAGFQYAVTRDGKRFLAVDSHLDLKAKDLSIVFNWPQLLNRDGDR